MRRLLAGVRAGLLGGVVVGAAMTHVLGALTADFTAAARLLRAGSAEAAMVTLLPLLLTEDELVPDDR